MLRHISKTSILVAVTLVLVFAGAAYVHVGYTISTISFFQPRPCVAEPETVVVKEVVVKKCPEHGIVRWKIGELTMKAGLKYPQPSTQSGRTDVNAVTNWNVPLVWEGTFDPVVIDDIYKKMNPRIAVVVFAVGKYTRFLKGFLESGEKYFFVGFRVTYYIFTDNEKDVPKVNLGKGRKITVVDVPSAKRWQDVVLGRMKWASIAIDKRDTKRDSFPYERRPQSKAYIPAGEGDYYYTAAVWGGYLEEMYKLVKYCYDAAEEDAKNKIEAVWQEESHLNKYLLYNKPTKVLSPEFLWSDYDTVPADIKVVRISQLVKNYAGVRPHGGH